MAGTVSYSGSVLGNKGTLNSINSTDGMCPPPADTTRSSSFLWLQHKQSFLWDLCPLHHKKQIQMFNPKCLWGSLCSGLLGGSVFVIGRMYVHVTSLCLHNRSFEIQWAKFKGEWFKWIVGGSNINKTCLLHSGEAWTSRVWHSWVIRIPKPPCEMCVMGND